MTKLALHRGYCVATDLVEDLVSELDKLGADYKLVGEDYHLPKGKAETPRPVMVTDKPKPEGWTRYTRCKQCKVKGVGLTGEGHVIRYHSCRDCSKEDYSLTKEETWQTIESSFGYKYLRLPSWIDGLDVRTISDVREGLKTRTLKGVGPEREMVVQEALNRFRCEITNALVEMLGVTKELMDQENDIPSRH